MKSIQTILLCLAVVLFKPLDAFTVRPQRTVSSLHAPSSNTNNSDRCNVPLPLPHYHTSSSKLQLADLDTVALVAGQENYGFAVVALIEAIYSFVQAPSLSHAKVLVPAGIAAVLLVAVSGPMVTSGNADSVALGLEIATGVSVLLGVSYVARMAAPYSPSPKEAAFAGLLVAIAGFFSFSQNLIVDGFGTY